MFQQCVVPIGYVHSVVSNYDYRSLIGSFCIQVCDLTKASIDKFMYIRGRGLNE